MQNNTSENSYQLEQEEMNKYRMVGQYLYL